MDAAQWQQHQHQQVAGFSRPMEEMIHIPNNNNNNTNNNNPTSVNNSRATTPIVGDQRRARPQKDQNLNCPRCNSTNTKFCYYNNYSLTQPRYFCKTCRRYWTQGGSLRNVPVGGGSRKNKRSSSSSSSSITTTSSNHNIPTKLIPDLNPPSSLSHLITSTQNPKFLEGHDLNLAFPMQGIFHPNNNNENHEPINIMNSNNNNGSNTNNHHNNPNSCSTTTSSTPISALELLRTGIASRGSSLNPYVPMPMPDSNTLYPSGFPHLQEFKTNMNMFTATPGDHHNDNSMIGSADNDNSNNNVGGGNGANNSNNNNNNAARLLFPFADMNKLANSTPATTTLHHQELVDDQSKGGNDHHHQHHHHHPHHHHQGQPTTGYWSGMLGGGTW